MFYLYSILLTIAFVLLLPVFFVRRAKYAAGFRERLGLLPDFDPQGSRVLWLHCVSVGETNAARALVDVLLREYPEWKIVVSTTTETGQRLAKDVFDGRAALVFHFPFDWAFAVRRALSRIRPGAVLLMETEIWPNFIREAKRAGAEVAIVNGRLSQRSFDRYSRIGFFIGRVLSFVDLALMQAQRDAERITALGMPSERTAVPGNLKFDRAPAGGERLTEELAGRFAFGSGRPLIVAASTHDPEERWVIEAYAKLRRSADARLVLVPRHPERFDSVAATAASSGFASVRRSAPESAGDASADIVTLDTIGELRHIYPLADLVFCGGSLIPHGGQSMLEPAAEGKAVVTGPFTHNFAEAVEVFSFHDAIVRLSEEDVSSPADSLAEAFGALLSDVDRRLSIGRNAKDVMERNRGAAERTAAELGRLLGKR